MQSYESKSAVSVKSQANINAMRQDKAEVEAETWVALSITAFELAELF